MTNRKKPGENHERSGKYEEREPRGRRVPHPRQVTIKPGDNPMSPTQEPNRSWERVGSPKR